MERDDILSLLEHINPASLSYADWVSVGMALKHEGLTAADWEAWSKRDYKRYHAGECERKWQSFNGSAAPVTGGTIYELARQSGWMPAKGGRALDWDSVISAEPIVDQEWIQSAELCEPSDSEWQPHREIIRYLELLFGSDENVGYVTESWQNDEGKYLPTKGHFDRTAGELIDALSKCGGDIGAVFGDYNPECGAWIRFNPVDGQGIKDENVTDYRYALVESDGIDVGKQYSIMRELELPIAVMVHSGKKSIHAIVRVDAESYSDYRSRVNYLYDVCAKNGLNPDQSNRNPSRLSRMPGVMRGGHKQYIIDSNLGKANFAEWREWIEAASDDLPEVESFGELRESLPPLAPCLIDGILRQGHKMLLSGPSKAGKSFALIELCCAIAEGREWFGFRCARGRVLYVNLELDRASCLHRFADVYSSLGWEMTGADNIDIWNLRGRSSPMDKLAPSLIRRAQKHSYIAVIIDPIYKVITGDENSADQMALFCNQFDKIATEIGCAVIYCHHHSKGAQGQKRSMDRASGSGVFARDPDALVDMLELNIPKDMRAALCSAAMRSVLDRYLERIGIKRETTGEDLVSLESLSMLCKNHLSADEFERLVSEVDAAEAAARRRTAWRLEGTLREFANFEPVNLWFDYPIHRIDKDGGLKGIKDGDGDPGSIQFAQKSYQDKGGERKEKRGESIDTAFSAVATNGVAKLKDVAEYLNVSDKTVKRWIEGNENYSNEHGFIMKVDNDKNVTM